MQKVVLLVSVFVLSCFYQLWACPSPANIEGVAFTSGESLNIEVLMDMGTENVNYFIDGDSLVSGIRYMSHYDPQTMVFIGNYGMSYQQGIRMACMGIILPLPDSADEYMSIDKATFNFAAAVKAELEWLVDNDVVDLSLGLGDQGLVLSLSAGAHDGVHVMFDGLNVVSSLDEMIGQLEVLVLLRFEEM